MEIRDAEYYDRLWQNSAPKDGMKHTRETWDRLARDWKKDSPEIQAIKDRQCDELTAFLSDRGVLGEDASVIDIGCGSGNYAVRFAEHAAHVTCTDISPKMLDFCREHANERGVSNLDFVECDFLSTDINDMGWEGKFDLVFTSLTPAMDGLESVNKTNAMSRNWCFNNSFVYRNDNLRNAVMESVFEMPVTNRWGNSSTYCLFNILWQLGFAPEIRYYKEVIEFKKELTTDVARAVAVNIIRDREPSGEEVKKTLEYLEANLATDGKVTHRTESLYSWMLWNVMGDPR